MLKVVVSLLAAGALASGCTDKPAQAPDPQAGLRHACRTFIERAQMETRSGADWGEYWNWTVVPNADATFSVGARYAVNGGTRYTTCVIRKSSDGFKLESLTRLQ